MKTGVCTCNSCGRRWKYGDSESPMLSDDAWRKVLSELGLPRGGRDVFVCRICMEKALGHRPGMQDLRRDHVTGGVVPFNGPYIADMLCPDRFELFANISVGTDVRSYGVWSVDEARGFARAIPVEKRIRPEFVPGGFSAICVNNDDFHRESEVYPVLGAEPVTLTRRRGCWGIDMEDVFMAHPVSCYRDPEQTLRDNPSAELRDTPTGKWIFWIRRTKAGKPGRRFEKLCRQFDTVCRYYYDYNF